MMPRLSILTLSLALIFLGGVGGKSASQWRDKESPEAVQHRERSIPPESAALLPEFVLISTGMIGLPLASSTEVTSAFWHPGASGFVRPMLVYTHSIRHFPAGSIASAGGKRTNVDQLDADLVVHGTQGMWGGKTRFYTVAGEWGFDHQSQKVEGFPQRRLDGRLEGQAYGRRIFSWMSHGCSLIRSRFRAFSHGTHIGNWATARQECGTLIRIFPWFTIASSRATLRMDTPVARKRSFTTAASILPSLVQISFSPLFSFSYISRKTISGNLSALALTVSFISAGEYLYLPSGEVLLGGRGRFVATRLPLPGISLRYGETKEVLPMLISFPWDRPENVPMTPQFRDIHIASVSMPN